VKQAGLFVLFSTILLIPRLRRLRRRVGAWTGIRVAAILAAAWCFGRLGYGTESFKLLVLGTSFLAFALLVRARPAMKSAEDLARELDALVVLNGGTFLSPEGGRAESDARIIVSPETIYVVGGRNQRLLEIPLARVRRLQTLPLGEATLPAKTWELRLALDSEDSPAAVFRFEGYFAKHLAGIAESTLRKLRTIELPVLKA
jgi:hypothetical protein